MCDLLIWNGGLLSPTINIERSLGVDKGVVACTEMVSSGLSIGLSSGEMVDGFSRKGCLGAGGSFGFSRIEISGCFSRKRESDNGEGVVRSREDAAQSQWVDRAP